METCVCVAVDGGGRGEGRRTEFYEKCHVHVMGNIDYQLFCPESWLHLIYIELAIL